VAAKVAQQQKSYLKKQWNRSCNQRNRPCIQWDWSIVHLYHSTLQPTKQPQQSNQTLACAPLKSCHTKHCIQMA